MVFAWLNLFSEWCVRRLPRYVTTAVTIATSLAIGFTCTSFVFAGEQEQDLDPPSEQQKRVSCAENNLNPEDTPVPEVPPDPRLLSLPLVKRICKATPPSWAVSSRENTFPAQSSHRPLFLEDNRLLWGRHVINAATGEILEEMLFGEKTDLITMTRLSHNRKFVLLSRTKPFDQSTFALPTPWLEVWNLETRQQHGSNLVLDGRMGEADADLTNDGNTVAVARGSEVELWNVVSGAKIKTLPVDLNDFEKGYQGRAPFFEPEFLRFSPDNHWLVVFSPNNVVYSRWQTDKKPKVIHVGRRLEAFAFTPDSRLLAEGPGPRTNLHVRKLSSFDIVRTLFDEADSPLITSGLAFTPDGKTLIASNDITVDETKLKIPHRLHFWDLKKGILVRQMTMPLYRPRWLDVSPDGRWLAVRLEDLEAAVLAVWPLND